MAKRFSTREMTLLTLPVLAIGAFLWNFKRYKGSLDNRQLRVTFHIEKPSTLEAFAGYDGTLAVQIRMEGLDLTRCTRTLELQPTQTPQTSKFQSTKRIIWKDSVPRLPDSRHLLKIRDLPRELFPLASTEFLQPGTFWAIKGQSTSLKNGKSTAANLKRLGWPRCRASQ